MKRHLTACILAALLAQGTLPVSADTAIAWHLTPNHYTNAALQATETVDGKAVGTISTSLYGFVAVTDGSALSDTVIEQLQSTVERDWVMEELQREDLPSLPEEYAENAKFYQIYYTIPAYEIEYRAARRTMLETPEIVDVLALSYQIDGTFCWNGQFDGIRPEGLGDEYDMQAALAEDEAYLAAKAVYDEWLTLQGSPEQLGDTEYEMLQYAIEYAQTSLHPAAYEMAMFVPGVTFTPDTETAQYHVTSWWTEVGEVSGDDTVNAKDASAILAYAAAEAAGNSTTQLALPMQTADVNADGAVNAKDAACVLIYAAAESAGLDLTWVDILKK